MQALSSRRKHLGHAHDDVGKPGHGQFLRASALRDVPISLRTWFLVALEDARDEIHDPVFGDAGLGIERSFGSIDAQR